MKKTIKIALAISAFVMLMLACITANAYQLPDDAIKPGRNTHESCVHDWADRTFETYPSCTEPAIMRVECIKCGDYYFAQGVQLEHTKYTYINPADADGYDGSVVVGCERCDKIYSRKTIPYPETLKLSAKTFTDNGKARRPRVTVYDRKGKVIDSKYYTVKYNCNASPGVASVAVTFKDRYTGTLIEEFKIRPESTAIKSAKYKSTGKINVSWKRNTKYNGYIVQYSTSPKFTTRTTCCYVVSDKSKTSCTIGSLAQKTYYVRVATCKTLRDGSRIAGKWSDSKKVVVKKGASLKAMINYTKTDTTGRKDILSLTSNSVDIKKYKTTYDRMKAIYNWHAKNYNKFSSCMECNCSFNTCVSLLFKGHRKYDDFIWLAAGEFKNRDGSRAIHKWSVISIQGVELIFDPRLQGYTGDYTGNTYFGVKKGSALAKRYLFDGWMFYWDDEYYLY